MMRRGTRVMTPLGEGMVRYVRMAPPDYGSVAAASVLLDDALHDIVTGKRTTPYVGTMFDASMLTILTEEDR